ncbi:hypothetical protein EYZ11_009567 [Aspergillus tanneri]|uniref:Late endosomal/lysosomal adaptor and MAPK and MTOR activator-domain-containing protein n=1 Tax=Aspergillus tanneri TaxID=1220188 RepID=A0A4S3J7K1_9EURO|nr:uncharacterized protein ATNIH1004_008727 [Aspergillus tanneri]KAA8644523.1 hypothetical protein ATNIH1004_008727 [Aspergillus tanneri]THC90959.1 hypothetical protein EYZ11_009567 [Aspergillus tanneri]
MGVCASCLGLSRRDSQDSESSRLLEDDIYQSGYGYGALNNHANQISHPDSGYIKREREALEAICQRTSDSVIDIWSIQPQPHLQPQATLRGSVSPATSKSGGTDDAPIKITTTSPSDDSTQITTTKTGTVPKHWGEVVINPRMGRPPGIVSEENVRDVFGVLKVT